MVGGDRQGQEGRGEGFAFWGAGGMRGVQKGPFHARVGEAKCANTQIMAAL